MVQQVTYSSLMDEIHSALVARTQRPAEWNQFLSDNKEISSDACERAAEKLGDHRSLLTFVLLQRLGTTYDMAISLVELVEASKYAVRALWPGDGKQDIGGDLRAKLQAFVLFLLRNCTGGKFSELVPSPDGQVQFVTDMMDYWLPSIY